jgi:hypothetical protein
MTTTLLLTFKDDGMIEIAEVVRMGGLGDTK